MSKPRTNAVNSKHRFMEVKEVLERHSHKDKMLTLSEIQEKLYERYPDHSIKVDTIKRDIDYLIELGFDINKKKDTAWRYQVVRRHLSIDQLRLLIDAVTSSRSITERETRKLVAHLKMMASKEEAQQLSNEIRISQAIKMKNEMVQVWISAIHEAIPLHCTIRFKYAKYGLNKQLVWHNNRQFYEIEPYELVWNSDFYYLIGKKPGETGWRHFRVDRMHELHKTCNLFQRQPFKLATYMEQMFHMYAGPVREVTVLVHHHLVNAMIDKFGLSLQIQQHPDQDYFEIAFKAADSDGLIRWLLTWGSQVKVVSPLEIREKMKNEALQMLQHYST